MFTQHSKTINEYVHVVYALTGWRILQRLLLKTLHRIHNLSAHTIADHRVQRDKHKQGAIFLKSKEKIQEKH